MGKKKHIVKTPKVGVMDDPSIFENPDAFQAYLDSMHAAEKLEAKETTTFPRTIMQQIFGADAMEPIPETPALVIPPEPTTTPVKEGPYVEFDWDLDFMKIVDWSGRTLTMPVHRGSEIGYLDAQNKAAMISLFASMMVLSGTPVAVFDEGTQPRVPLNFDKHHIVATLPTGHLGCFYLPETLMDDLHEKFSELEDATFADVLTLAFSMMYHNPVIPVDEEYAALTLTVIEDLAHSDVMNDAYMEQVLAQTQPGDSNIHSYVDMFESLVLAFADIIKLTSMLEDEEEEEESEEVAPSNPGYVSDAEEDYEMVKREVERDFPVEEPEEGTGGPVGEKPFPTTEYRDPISDEPRDVSGYDADNVRESDSGIERGGAPHKDLQEGPEAETEAEDPTDSSDVGGGERLEPVAEQQATEEVQEKEETQGTAESLPENHQEDRAQASQTEEADDDLVIGVMCV